METSSCWFWCVYENRQKQKRKCKKEKKKLKEPFNTWYLFILQLSHNIFSASSFTLTFAVCSDSFPWRISYKFLLSKFLRVWLILEVQSTWVEYLNKICINLISCGETGFLDINIRMIWCVSCFKLCVHYHIKIFLVLLASFFMLGR